MKRKSSQPSSSRRSSTPDVLQKVLFGSIADIKQLVRSGTTANMAGRHGFTPLMNAVIRGDPTITEYLLQKGADVNKRNDIGQTALLIGAKEGQKAILEQLVAAGADPTATDNERRNAISWASTQGDFPELVSFLIAVGADYNARDVRGLTPLMNAALLDRVRTAAVLLTAGADENITYQGRTAYEMAREHGHQRVCKTMQSVLENRPKGHKL